MTCRLIGVVAMTLALGLTTGCSEPANAGSALGDFAVDFARNALAAFLL